MRSEPGSPEFSKTRTFSSFAIQNIEAMRLLREFGLLGRSEDERGKKATATIDEKEQSFRNIAEHSLVVGMTSDIIFEELEKRGFLTDEERREGTRAAIIHDMLKRGEIEMKASRGKTEYGTQEELNKAKQYVFEKAGISEDQIEEYRLTKRASFDTIETSPEQVSLDTPDDLREWTIFYTDLSVSHTNIVGPDVRVDEVRQRGSYKKTYADKYYKISGQNPEDVDLESAAEKGMEQQVAIAHAVEGQLKRMLDLPEDVSLPQFIREHLEQRYAEHTT